MAPLTGAASFAVTCAAPCVNPTGTVALDTAGRIATFTLAPETSLAPSTRYTATVTAAASLATGLTLATPFVWHFTTGATADVTRPTVILTVPVTTTPGPTPAVPANTAITATFSEDMTPGTLTAASFTVTCSAPCVSPVGAVVSYDVPSRTALFTPPAVLTVGTTYTATVTAAATDLAGNALAGDQAALPAASDYVWDIHHARRGVAVQCCRAVHQPDGGFRDRIVPAHRSARHSPHRAQRAADEPEHAQRNHVQAHRSRPCDNSRRRNIRDARRRHRHRRDIYSPGRSRCEFDLYGHSPRRASPA